MAIDFPATPTLNQVFTQGGQSWTWDGTKWNSLTGGFSDAPSDGFTYGRKNAAWSSVDALLAPAVQAGAYNVGRNVVHNPLFNIAQRGAGPFSGGMYSADRWLVGASVSTLTTNIAGLIDTDRASIGDEAAQACLSNNFTGTAGTTDFAQVSQCVENVHRLSGKTVTVSFWATGSAISMRIGVNLRQSFGSGGSPSAPVDVNGQAVTLSATAGAWTRQTVTFSVPSVAGKTFGSNGGDFTQLQFWFSAGATYNTVSGSVGVHSGTINLWGVQLEIGSVATPLEKPDPADDLRKCMRFAQVFQTWHRSYAMGAGQVSGATVVWPQMRATPTTTALAGGTAGNITAGTLAAATNNSGAFFITAAAAGDFYNVNVVWLLSADF